MSKKIQKKVTKSRPAAAPAKIVKTTPARNTPLPKIVAKAASKVVSHEMIAKRAYEIFLGGGVGDETANWLAAERELRG
jgi:hypothetical protein